MIDIHCHLLPGVDDGSQTLEESCMMAEIAIDSGVKTLVTTPHCNYPGEDPNFFSRDLAGVYTNLKAELAKRGLDINLYFGMEVFGSMDVAALLREKKVVSLNNTRYVLIEFYFNDDPARVLFVLQQVIRAGYVPVIAHPERYRFMRPDHSTIFDMLDMGCLFQINRGSIRGVFGREIQDTALKMLDHGFADFVASDSHSPFHRTPYLFDVYEFICDNFSKSYAAKLLYENPAKLLANESIVKSY